MIRIGALIAASIVAGALLAREIPDVGSPVSVVVTVAGQKNAPAPQLTMDDVLVSQNKQHMQITGLEPLRSESGLQLWLLIDDGSASTLGTQLADLKKFVLAQPSTAQIGIGYMRNGGVQTAQLLTSDHELAAKAIRLPSGPPGISASPYLALVELIHKWPTGSPVREVLMVSSGVDPDNGSGPQNPYLSQAIDAAQRAGVVVHSIYYSGAGPWARAYGQIYWGQNYLAQLSDETGGEFYWLGTSNPVSMTPFLDDLNQRLSGQYLLTFLAKPERKSGFQNVKISTELPHVKLEGPSKVYVPASQ
ncbi:MAG: hypothetical protein ABSH32_08580 [Bryobacteraceae bacterium]|jgi:hypothetical protein